MNVVQCARCFKDRPDDGELCPYCKTTRSINLKSVSVLKPVAVPVPAPAPVTEKKVTPKAKPAKAAPKAEEKKADEPKKVEKPKEQKEEVKPEKSTVYAHSEQAVHASGGGMSLTSLAVLVAGFVVLVLVAIQLADPYAIARLDFRAFGGPQESVRWTWNVGQIYDPTFFVALFNGIQKAAPAVNLFATVVGLVYASAILDSMSNLTGADWSGVMGQLLAVVAILLPSTLLRVVGVTTACWAMSRNRDARRDSLHWLLIAGFVALGVFLIGDNYRSWPTMGILGLGRAFAHVLFSANQTESWMLVLPVILWFTWGAFRAGTDGSSQGTLLLMLALLGLWAGQIPFTGIHDRIALLVFVHACIILGGAIFLKEILRDTAVVDEKKKFQFSTKKFGGNFVLYVVVCVLALLLNKNTMWPVSLLWAIVIAYAFPTVVVGVIKQWAASSPESTQFFTSLLNGAIGDHASLGIVVLFNDNFNFLMTLIGYGVLFVPAIAKLFGV